MGLQLDLPVGEGHKSGVRRTNLVLLPPALALCPDLARGENQMSTSTDNNANNDFAMAEMPLRSDPENLVIENSAGGISYFELHSQSTEERATLDR